MASKTPHATWWLLGSLYTTQYFGLGFFVVALVAILREQGAPLEQLGMVFLLGMIWPFKFLWAPLVDRIRLGRLGHYRAWILVMQAGLVMTFLAMGQFQLIDDFSTVYLLCLLVALLSATQDIAVDGLVCRLLSPTERGMGNGIQIAGGLLGNMLGGGMVLIAYPYLGWQATMVILAGGTAVSLVQLLWFREPQWSVAMTARANILLRIRAFWKRPGGRYWLMLLLIYPVGSSLAYALITPILVDAGWGLERIGFSVNVIGSLLGVLSALLTGWLLKHFHRRKALIGAAVVQVPGIFVVALPVFGYTGNLEVMLAIGLYFLLYNPAATVLATVMMDQSSIESPATDYSIQFSLYIFFAMGMMTISSTLAGMIGYLGVLVIAAAAAVAAAVLSLGYRHHPEKQSAVGEFAHTTDSVATPPIANT